MKENSNWDKVIDFVQAGMILLLILIVALCIVTLILFDGVVGAGSMLYLTKGNMEASVGISMATSGLLMSLMFIAYSLVSPKQTKMIMSIGNALLVFAGLIYVLDIYFDSLTADYLRYGAFVAIADLPNLTDKITQVLFRLLVAGLSTVGETLAIAIILGMPILKNVIGDALPRATHQEPNKPKEPPMNDNRGKFPKSGYHPKHKPHPEPARFGGYKHLLDEVTKDNDAKG